MDVTPANSATSRSAKAFRGYHRDEVDELLERAAATIEGLHERSRVSSPSRLAQAEARPPGEPRPRPTTSSSARCCSRSGPPTTRSTRPRHAPGRCSRSRRRSRVASSTEAEATARRIAECERRRLEAEILDLGARREALRADVDALEEFEREYRDAAARRGRGRARARSAAFSADMPGRARDARRRASRRRARRADSTIARVDGRVVERASTAFLSRRRRRRRRRADAAAAAHRAPSATCGPAPRTGARRAAPRPRPAPRRRGAGGATRRRPSRPQRRRPRPSALADYVPDDDADDAARRSTTTRSSRRCARRCSDDAPLGPAPTTTRRRRLLRPGRRGRGRRRLRRRFRRRR